MAAAEPSQSYAADTSLPATPPIDVSRGGPAIPSLIRRPIAEGVPAHLLPELKPPKPPLWKRAITGLGRTATFLFGSAQLQTGTWLRETFGGEPKPFGARLGIFAQGLAHNVVQWGTFFGGAVLGAAGGPVGAAVGAAAGNVVGNALNNALSNYYQTVLDKVHELSGYRGWEVIEPMKRYQEKVEAITVGDFHQPGVSSLGDWVGDNLGKAVAGPNKERETLGTWVDGISTFGVDILTDPFFWLGSSVGAKGARALGGIQGKAVEASQVGEQTTARLIQEAAQESSDAIADSFRAARTFRREIDADLDPKQLLPPPDQRPSSFGPKPPPPVQPRLGEPPPPPIDESRVLGVDPGHQPISLYDDPDATQRFITAREHFRAINDASPYGPGHRLLKDRLDTDGPLGAQEVLEVGPTEASRWRSARAAELFEANRNVREAYDIFMSRVFEVNRAIQGKYKIPGPEHIWASLDEELASSVRAATRRILQQFSEGRVSAGVIDETLRRLHQDLQREAAARAQLALRAYANFADRYFREEILTPIVRSAEGDRIFLDLLEPMRRHFGSTVVQNYGDLLLSTAATAPIRVNSATLQALNEAKRQIFSYLDTAKHLRPSHVRSLRRQFEEVLDYRNLYRQLQEHRRAAGQAARRALRDVEKEVRVAQREAEKAIKEAEKLAGKVKAARAAEESYARRAGIADEVSDDLFRLVGSQQVIATTSKYVSDLSTSIVGDIANVFREHYQTWNHLLFTPANVDNPQAWSDAVAQFIAGGKQGPSFYNLLGQRLKERIVALIEGHPDRQAINTSVEAARRVLAKPDASYTDRLTSLKLMLERYFGLAFGREVQKLEDLVNHGVAVWNTPGGQVLTLGQEVLDNRLGRGWKILGVNFQKGKPPQLIVRSPDGTRHEGDLLRRVHFDKATKSQLRKALRVTSQLPENYADLIARGVIASTEDLRQAVRYSAEVEARLVRLGKIDPQDIASALGITQRRADNLKNQLTLLLGEALEPLIGDTTVWGRTVLSPTTRIRTMRRISKLGIEPIVPTFDFDVADPEFLTSAFRNLFLEDVVRRVPRENIVKHKLTGSPPQILAEVRRRRLIDGLRANTQEMTDIHRSVRKRLTEMRRLLRDFNRQFPNFFAEKGRPGYVRAFRYADQTVTPAAKYRVKWRSAKKVLERYDDQQLGRLLSDDQLSYLNYYRELLGVERQLADNLATIKDAVDRVKTLSIDELVKTPIPDDIQEFLDSLPRRVTVRQGEDVEKINAGLAEAVTVARVGNVIFASPSRGEKLAVELGRIAKRLGPEKMAKLDELLDLSKLIDNVAQFAVTKHDVAGEITTRLIKMANSARTLSEAFEPVTRQVLGDLAKRLSRVADTVVFTRDVRTLVNRIVASSRRLVEKGVKAGDIDEIEARIVGLLDAADSTVHERLQTAIDSSRELSENLSRQYQAAKFQVEQARAALWNTISPRARIEVVAPQARLRTERSELLWKRLIERLDELEGLQTKITIIENDVAVTSDLLDDTARLVRGLFEYFQTQPIEVLEAHPKVMRLLSEYPKIYSTLSDKPLKALLTGKEGEKFLSLYRRWLNDAEKIAYDLVTDVGDRRVIGKAFARLRYAMTKPVSHAGVAVDIEREITRMLRRLAGRSIDRQLERSIEFTEKAATRLAKAAEKAAVSGFGVAEMDAVHRRLVRVIDGTYDAEITVLRRLRNSLEDLITAYDAQIKNPEAVDELKGLFAMTLESAERVADVFRMYHAFADPDIVTMVRANLLPKAAAIVNARDMAVTYGSALKLMEEIDQTIALLQQQKGRFLTLLSEATRSPGRTLLDYLPEDDFRWVDPGPYRERWIRRQVERGFDEEYVRAFVESLTTRDRKLLKRGWFQHENRALVLKHWPFGVPSHTVIFDPYKAWPEGIKLGRAWQEREKVVEEARQRAEQEVRERYVPQVGGAGPPGGPPKGPPGPPPGPPEEGPPGGGFGPEDARGEQGELFSRKPSAEEEARRAGDKAASEAGLAFDAEHPEHRLGVFRFRVSSPLGLFLLKQYYYLLKLVSIIAPTMEAKYDMRRRAMVDFNIGFDTSLLDGWIIQRAINASQREAARLENIASEVWFRLPRAIYSPTKEGERMRFLVGVALDSPPEVVERMVQSLRDRGDTILAEMLRHSYAVLRSSFDEYWDVLHSRFPNIERQEFFYHRVVDILDEVAPTTRTVGKPFLPAYRLVPRTGQPRRLGPLREEIERRLREQLGDDAVEAMSPLEQADEYYSMFGNTLHFGKVALKIDAVESFERYARSILRDVREKALFDTLHELKSPATGERLITLNRDAIHAVSFGEEPLTVADVVKSLGRTVTAPAWRGVNLGTLWIDPAAVPAVEYVLGVFRTHPKVVVQFAEVLGTLRAIWSRVLLLPFTGYHLRNMYSDIRLMLMSPAYGGDMRKVFSDIVAAIYLAAKQRRRRLWRPTIGEMLGVGDEALPLDESLIYHAAYVSGVVPERMASLSGRNFVATATEPVWALDLFDAQMRVGRPRQLFRETREWLESLAGGPDAPKGMQRLAENLSREPWFPGVRLGAVQNNVTRYALFRRALLEQVEGVDDAAKLAEVTRIAAEQPKRFKMMAEAAADVVRDYLFDYDELSQYERVFRRTVAPFYTWVRKNLALQFGVWLRNPAVYTALYEAEARVFDMTTTQEQQQMVSPWALYTTGMIPVDEPAADLSRLFSVMDSIYLTMRDLSEEEKQRSIFYGVSPAGQTLRKYTMGVVSGPAVTLAELLTGREFRTGRKLEGNVEAGPLLRALPLPKRRVKVGYDREGRPIFSFTEALPAWLAYAVEQLVPGLSRVPQLVSQPSMRGGQTDRQIASLLLGLRTPPEITERELGIIQAREKAKRRAEIRRKQARGELPVPYVEPAAGLRKAARRARSREKRLVRIPARATRRVSAGRRRKTPKLRIRIRVRKQAKSRIRSRTGRTRRVRSQS